MKTLFATLFVSLLSFTSAVAQTSAAAPAAQLTERKDLQVFNDIANIWIEARRAIAQLFVAFFAAFSARFSFSVFSGFFLSCFFWWSWLFATGGSSADGTLLG